jgi:hypothetical protein
MRDAFEACGSYPKQLWSSFGLAKVDYLGVSSVGGDFFRSHSRNVDSNSRSQMPIKMHHSLFITNRCWMSRLATIVAVVYNQRECTGTALKLNTISCSLYSNYVSCPVDRYA